jgi:hypothetical protein
MKTLLTAIILSFTFDIAVDATCGLKKAYDCHGYTVCVVID